MGLPLNGSLLYFAIVVVIVNYQDRVRVDVGGVGERGQLLLVVDEQLGGHVLR